MRKTDCRHYSECLTTAAKANLVDLDCDSCLNYSEERNPGYGDGTQHFLFLWALFRPELYRRYRQLECLKLKE